MDQFFRPTWAEISLDALRHNIAGFREIIPSDMKLMAVVKANAYGHGAVMIAKEAIDSGVDYLAVAFLDEALELRAAGISYPILVLGYTPPEGIPLALEQDITLTVFSDEILEAIKQNKSLPRKLKIHIKIDSGMNRVGVHYSHDTIAFIDQALRMPQVEVEGLFTHFAKADEMDKTYTYEQYERFNQIVEHYRQQDVSFPYLHTGNSATAIDLPQLSYNMVRIGISMYGLYPSQEVNKHKIKLKPVMSFKTKVVMVKELPPQSGISYGAIYYTEKEEQVATLPVGYADGYSRNLSNRTDVLIRGKRVPVVGRICMDQCVINVTDCELVQTGEEVVLFGSQGEEQLPADELAEILGTINYEITCMVARRVPRIYIRNGEIVEKKNELLRK